MAKLGAHVLQGSRNGYGAFCEAKPAVCLLVDQDPAETKQKSGAHTVTIFRADSVYGEAPPGYTNHPDPAALARQWYPALKAKWLLNSADFFQCTNEQGGGEGPEVESNLLHLIAFEREIMRLANLDGLKVCVLNLAGGSPGDIEIWKRVCLPFIIEAWANKNIYARHSYGGGDLVNPDGSVVVGNPSRPFEEVGYLRAAGATGGVVITEAGIDAGFGFAGIERFTQQLTGYEKLQRPYPEFIGCCGYTLGKWGEGDMDSNCQDALPALAQYLLDNPTPKWKWPTDTIPPSDNNLLPNPSFENDWWHIDGIPELQIANQFDTEWKEGEVSPGGHPYVRPEYRVLPAAQLPPEERPLYILDGIHTVKVFKGYGAIDTIYRADAVPLPAGRYRLSIPVYPDAVMGYNGGQKIFADDPLAAEASIWHDGEQEEWANLFPFGEWRELVYEFELAEARPIQLGVRLRNRWGLQNNGWFTDNWRLEQVDSAPPPDECRGRPRTQYNRTYVLLPPSANKDWARAVIDGSWDRNRYTLGGSADDAGIGDLDQRNAIVVNPAQWGPGEDGTGIVGFYEKYYPGVRLNMLEADTPDELAVLLSGQDPINDIDLTIPLSGPFVITSALNDERDYDGDGDYDDLHEGVDFAPTAPGSRVLAAAPGTVAAVRNSGGYGLYVILSHDDGRYFTWYCHMNRIDVVEGQQVARSQALGLVGSTGNSSGPHVHFNLQVPGYGLPGYVIPHVANPLSHMDLAPIPYGDHPVAFGLHASADPEITAEEVAMFGVVKPEMIKVMSLHNPEAIRQLATQHPAAKWVVRAYLSFKDRPAVTPQQFYDDTISDVRRTLDAIGAGRDVVIELHNEPNLTDEGLGVSWADGTGFRDWYLQLLLRYRQALPAARFLFPGLSPGGDVPGVRQGHQSFVNQCRDAVLASDGLATHIYWAANYPMSTALAVLDDYRARFPAQAIWVTESCNNQAGPTPTQKGQEYILFWQLLRQRPLMRGVTYFVASASNEAWGWGPGGTGQTWLGTVIPQIVGGR